MPKPINNFMPEDLEFQMFVLDEHADKLLDEGKDVLKLTIGVPELPTPRPRTATGVSGFLRLAGTWIPHGSGPL